MIPKKIKYCRNCLLPSNTPNTTLNNKGICNLCADFKFKNFKTISKIKNNSRFELEKLLRNYPKNSGYDCIVALSGGKDSSYLTWLLVKKYGLKTLTITVDNGFMSPLALKNIELLTRKLNVDHKFIRAQALFNLVYRYAFKHDFFSTHQGRACNICCSLVPNLVFKYAIRKNIPIVFNGKFG